MPHPAFEPYYQALLSLGRAGRTQEIAEITGRTPASVSNAFGYHLRMCRERNVVPMVTKLQNGVYAVNVAKTEAPPKHHAKPDPTPSTTQLFELFHTTKSGTRLVRGEDGAVYKLEELDF